MILGLSGYARSGKDSVADILVKDAGFVRVAFADKLREALYALNPIVAHGKTWGSPLYLQPIIDVHGWDGVKETDFGPEIRRLLQRFGTEAGRNVLGDNIWVQAVLNSLDPSKKYVATDCRFANEATAVDQVWRVTRPGVEPANDHVSEIGLDNWPFDRIVYNDGSLFDLREKVIEGARRI